MNRRFTALLLAALSACSIQSNLSRDVDAAELRVTAEPANARVIVDEHFAATAAASQIRPINASVGTHRVTVEAPGYFPHDIEVAFVPGVTTLDIKLRKIPE